MPIFGFFITIPFLLRYRLQKTTGTNFSIFSALKGRINEGLSLTATAPSPPFYAHSPKSVYAFFDFRFYLS